LDLLKVRAYGIKNPTHVKEERHKLSSILTQDEESPGKRSYPRDKKGNVDEWAAMMANQYEIATKLNKEFVDSKKEHIKT